MKKELSENRKHYYATKWMRLPMDRGISKEDLLIVGRLKTQHILRVFYSLSTYNLDTFKRKKYCAVTGNPVRFNMSFIWFWQQMTSPYLDGMCIDYYGKGKVKLCWRRPNDAGDYTEANAYLGLFEDNARECALRTIAGKPNSRNTKGSVRSSEELAKMVATRMARGGFHKG